MGTFIYALDAESGRLQWVNDSTGAQYIKQPHSAPSFAGVGPQGALVATEEHLIVPGGRSVPAVFRRADGQFVHFEINAGGKGTGGSFVAADAVHFYVHTREKGTRAFDIVSGVKTAFTPNEPAIWGDYLFAADSAQQISAYPANLDDDKNATRCGPSGGWLGGPDYCRRSSDCGGRRSTDHLAVAHTAGRSAGGR